MTFSSRTGSCAADEPTQVASSKWPPWRVLVTDLDGTLLCSDGSMSPDTVAAVERAAALGLEIVFATSRPPGMVTNVADSLACSPLAICSNGAVVYDVASDSALSQTLLPSNIAKRVAVDLFAVLPDLLLLAHLACDRWRGEARASLVTGVALAQVARRDWLVDEGVTHLSVIHPSIAPGALLDVVHQVAGNECSIARPDLSIAVVDVLGRGVSKDAALKALASERDWRTDDIVCFGNSANDIPMLMWAGHSIAVANADSAVRRVVDEVIPTNDEDGVAGFLNELFDASEAIAD